MLFTYFLLALETVELGKSILLPLKYSGFLLLLLSSVTPIFFFFFARYANDPFRLTFPSQSSSG